MGGGSGLEGRGMEWNAARVSAGGVDRVHFMWGLVGQHGSNPTWQVCPNASGRPSIRPRFSLYMGTAGHLGRI